MLDQLSSLPNIESLQTFLQRVLAAKAQDIEVIVLFGSMTKDYYSNMSDYDVFIVIKESQVRFLDRLLEYSRFSDGKVETLVYTVEETRQMFEDNHMLLLEVLKDGIVLWVDGSFWNELKEEFKTKLATEKLIPRKKGWTINP